MSITVQSGARLGFSLTDTATAQKPGEDYKDRMCIDNRTGQLFLNGTPLGTSRYIGDFDTWQGIYSALVSIASDAAAQLVTFTQGLGQYAGLCINTRGLTSSQKGKVTQYLFWDNKIEYNVITYDNADYILNDQTVSAGFKTLELGGSDTAAIEELKASLAAVKKTADAAATQTALAAVEKTADAAKETADAAATAQELSSLKSDLGDFMDGLDGEGPYNTLTEWLGVLYARVKTVKETADAAATQTDLDAVKETADAAATQTDLDAVKKTADAAATQTDLDAVKATADALTGAEYKWVWSDGDTGGHYNATATLTCTDSAKAAYCPTFPGLATVEGLGSAPGLIRGAWVYQISQNARIIGAVGTAGTVLYRLAAIEQALANANIEIPTPASTVNETAEERAVADDDAAATDDGTDTANTGTDAAASDGGGTEVVYQ